MTAIKSNMDGSFRIDSTVALPSHVRAPLGGVPKHMQTAIDAYCKAYRKVYHSGTKVTVKDGWIYLDNAKTNGVSLQRLKQITKQLNFRKDQ